ncbi:ubiquitin carboxyl-terminal hydrolase MINDY-3 homolog isoform X2 [Sitodiplosis mosellana]|uniref:ubiquitin carboxyl-terminal hydrolase MINDY-3 homolog isoform X2 n=1 Tax=Sitodiplosis mosellana TaxID=263140 RepID=UPI002444C142|nr:ubiquitin carboxyl-terminal hydrolase MINDY-3 homolog isoform X2 [Sitodiplosis mosellana]XP_055305234.1 ubiquitin carboxyl-terminal hydrolase MINDY-3 homolog isoform X2 [Sitodiplosis mosellana]
MADIAASASMTQASSNLSDEQELNEFREIVWGPNIRIDVFQRWSQGFEFSDSEPSALVQRQGGPCAVIAPVQAYLLKTVLSETSSQNFRDLTAEQCKLLLIQAICSILKKCKDDKFRIVTLPNEDTVPSNTAAPAPVPELSQVPAESSTSTEPSANVLPSQRTAGWVPDEFHERLSVHSFDNIEEVEQFYMDNYHVLTGSYGVLKFMYTVLLTKKVQNIIAELLDSSEPLIHDEYGCGSQGLINLMITGQAVPHVWDHDKDVGGLKLRGISQQSDIGFLTLMEQLRYCTVGSFYKNPKNPVWVMASETHLTVLFSNEKNLVSKETPSEVARRVFKSYDPDGNNFIPSPVLQDVLRCLELVSEPEYVDIMSKKLDPEGLGIILLNAFMDEFFPEEKRSTPDTFDLIHYNGIPRSNVEDQVKYHHGAAIILESDLRSVSISNPMITCLQTKWPNIEVNWEDNRTPSLN